MRRFFSDFFSTTLGQILAIIACASSITFGLFIVLLFYPGGPPRPPWPWTPTYRISSIARVLAQTPADARASTALSLQSPGYALGMTRMPTRCTVNTLDDNELNRTLREELSDIGATVSVHSCDASNPNGTIQILVHLSENDPSVLEVRTQRLGPEPPRLRFPFYGAILFMGVGVLAMSVWAVSRVIRPLRRLADKAEAFGREIELAPIEEEGPLEIRRAAHAFNLMQERITRSLHNRTRMLAAVSHDLRTPLTRMRLQLDTNESETVRDKLRKDIDLMQTMVSSALAFLSTGSGDENKEWLDLSALIATICDEYEEAGAAIRYEGPRQIRCFCRPDGMQRVLANLIDNALRFGETVVVVASVRADTILIDVSDDGPGIPETRLRDVLEPFVRLDPSRGAQPGSVGLGLAIVRDIVRAHGGELTLINRRPLGLTARIMLPESTHDRLAEDATARG
ncbi:MAG TPA: ATP-binding protein [Paraburkholderia sp.]|jgi:signal transduction histidine kinase|uniref:ATP-binding protein n=1 Tax=Paraburkholderia sp. TaxID=1926495 RepID=UPI002DF6792F|nr:ATP-binding protein [Paraburkholderia sp.]